MWGIIRAVNKMKRRALSDVYVLKLLSLYFGVEIAYLVIWTIIDRPVPQYVMLIDGVSTELQCACPKYGFTFWGVFLGYKFLWMFFGAIMAIKTRGIFDDYKESHQIAFSIYNSGAVALISIPLGLVLRYIPSATLIITVAAITLIFTVTLLALFGKIWIRIIFGDEKKLAPLQSKSTSPVVNSSATSTSMSENDTYTATMDSVVMQD